MLNKPKMQKKNWTCGDCNGTKMVDHKRLKKIIILKVSPAVSTVKH